MNMYENPVEHTEKMEREYALEIDFSVKNSVIYSECPEYSGDNSAETENSVEDTDTVSAVLRYSEEGKKTALLNFANFTNPGGGFIYGARAQEEYICGESDLYNVLVRFEEKFYSPNREMTNRELYRDRAIYSPDVVFIREGKTFKADVITCAAPYKTAAMGEYNVSEKENSDALRSRIRTVLGIAADQKVQTLILGAFGCGVFGQNPCEAAGYFRELLSEEFHGLFGKVVFAVPGGKNLTAFEKNFR